MDLLRCCVIDDEPLAASLISSYVNRTPSLKLAGEFNSAHEAFPLINSGEVDLLLLDIQMPELSGMEFVNLVPPTTMVIFVTAYDNYAIQGLRANAVDYLLKPVSYEDFLAGISRARERKSAVPAASAVTAECQQIMVKTEYRYRQITVADILFIEGLKDYVRIYIEGEARPVMTLQSLKSLEHALPDRCFMRVHKSFIVNLTKIRTIERTRILILNLTQQGAAYEIPVGDSYRQPIADYIASMSLSGD